jgi:hypothetical protein
VTRVVPPLAVPRGDLPLGCDAALPRALSYPSVLLPAFDLGVPCGRETGVKDLYRQHLKKLRGMSLGKARRVSGIDMAIVRR